MQYCVLDAKHGRGLFAKQGFAAGAFIARYSGEPLNTRTLPPAEQRPRTHMLRVPGTHDIIDGRPLADRLVRCRGGRGKAAWQPADSADLCQGYASLANAAPTDLGANVRMVFLPDDTALPGVRPLFSGAHFHETVLRLDRPGAPILEALAARHIEGGLDLTPYYPEFGPSLLVCATESRTSADINAYAVALADVLKSVRAA
jgi:hypothetical protein